MPGIGEFAGARHALTPITLDDGSTGYKLQVDGGAGGSKPAASSQSVTPASDGAAFRTVDANPATIVTGQITLTANSRAQLPNNALINGVVIKSDPANTAKVLVGGSGVTTAADGTGSGYIVAPGEAMSFGVTNTNAIYLISPAAAILSYGGN